VPYAPGQSVDAAALDVLAATYGAALRDVEITLPDGLRDVAPAKPASLRAGSETIVAARLHGAQASGDVVLRGKVAGAPFEARWPIDVRATSDEGNAWAARTWAAMRVADDERVGDDGARAEAVALSHRFRVPSRLTSLLVLESEAMFHAFGIARSERAFEWSGERAALGDETVAVGGAGEDNEKGKDRDVAGFGSGGMDDLSRPERKASPKKAEAALEPADPYLSPSGGGAGGGGRGPAAVAQSTPVARPAPAQPPPAPTMTALPPTAGATADAAASTTATRQDSKAGAPVTIPTPTTTGAPIIPRESPVAANGWRSTRPGRWMRRVWFRVSTIAADDRPAVDLAKIQSARAALAASPDARQRHADLAKLLVRQGSIDPVETLAAQWTERDPLDADALTLRATAKSWRGDRDGALRVLSGMLASPSLTGATLADVASTLARAEERAGRGVSACALRVAAAETKPADTGTVAGAVACEHAAGRSSSEARWLAAQKDDAARARVSAAAAKLAPAAAPAESLFGDVVVDATWDASSGVDLDVGIVDPSGRRLAWASAARNVRAGDCTSLAHEAVAVSSTATGPFVVEIVRADGSTESDRPVSGKLRVTSLGKTQIVPFVLTGARAQVARVDVRMDSRLEAIDGASRFGPCDPPFFTDASGIRRMKPGCQ
jgi:hypothetical protein